MSYVPYIVYSGISQLSYRQWTNLTTPWPGSGQCQ